MHITRFDNMRHEKSEGKIGLITINRITILESLTKVLIALDGSLHDVPLWIVAPLVRRCLQMAPAPKQVKCVSVSLQ